MPAQPEAHSAAGLRRRQTECDVGARSDEYLYHAAERKHVDTETVSFLSNLDLAPTRLVSGATVFPEIFPDVVLIRLEDRPRRTKNKVRPAAPKK